MESAPRPAIFLIGPTGSGKTPLGRLLEERGVKGRRCHHFDFGAELRAAAAGDIRPDLDAADLEAVRRSLRTGALFDESEFPLVLKIYQGFIGRRGPGPGDLIVLNGLPRHEDQARRMAALVRVEAVVVLDAQQDVVLERLRLDSGGDRAGRTDDAAETVRRKLEAYRERTLPLVLYYERAGAYVVRIDVTAATAAEDIRLILERTL